MIEFLVLLGGFTGGFVSGLTGFGTALSALPIWLQLLPSLVAAPMVVICSVVGHMQTLPVLWKELDWSRTLPFVVGGVLGVPIGSWLLLQVDPAVFKEGFGWFLLIYTSILLGLQQGRPRATGGKLADGAVGVMGGLLGGFAGLSGALPTLWASLRGWPKATRRGVFQGFNLSILSFALVTQSVGGLVNGTVLYWAAIAIPGTMLGAWIGRRVYQKLGDKAYDQWVLVILFLAGLSLIVL